MARGDQLDLLGERVAKPPPAPEFSLACMVADTLRRWATPGWKWTHIPLGEARDHKWVKRKGEWKRISVGGSRAQRMGANRGFADYLLLSPAGFPYFLELKRAKGGKFSTDQLEFQNWCVEHNVAYAVAKTYQQALDRLQGWGAVRSNVRVSA